MRGDMAGAIRLVALWAVNEIEPSWDEIDAELAKGSEYGLS
jgi:hypothetical protein